MKKGGATVFVSTVCTVLSVTLHLDNLHVFCLKLLKKWFAVSVLQILPELLDIITSVHCDRLGGPPRWSVMLLVGPDRQTDGNFQP